MEQVLKRERLRPVESTIEMKAAEAAEVFLCFFFSFDKGGGYKVWNAGHFPNL